MKIKKAIIGRYDDESYTQIVRSELSTVMISTIINIRINSLIEFVKATQKGERLINIQKNKYIHRYSNSPKPLKLNYKLYLHTIEYVILDLNRMVETYHHEFVAHIEENVEINLANSPKFDFCKNKFKENGIYISKIKGYNSINEIRRISNDLKHSYIQEYSLSKTLKLKSFRDFDRKLLVDKVNKYLIDVPNYILNLTNDINLKFPKIEVRKNIC
jgi:hypothetical protein